MKKIWILALGAMISFTACEKEEDELTEKEFVEKEHCEECGPDLDAYTDVHEIAVWHYEGTEEFEISLEEQWDENGHVHTEFFKTGGPSEAISVYFYDGEELYQFAGAGVSFGLAGSEIDLDTAEVVEFNEDYLFFSNDAEVGDSWKSYNWGKEVIKTFIEFSTIEVPAGEFCCKKIQINLGHNLICHQWVSEIGLIAEKFYQEGQEEPVAEYYLVDIEEHECDFDDEDEDQDVEDVEEDEETCDCQE